MDEKKCIRCGKIFYKRDCETESELMGWWKRKYCSEICQKSANRYSTENHGPYKLVKNEHNSRVEEFSKIINGEIVFVNGGKSKYFPDVRKDGFAYELQMLSKTPLIKKKEKWNDDEKHILLVIIPDVVKNMFDGIGVFHNGKIIKVS